MFHEYKIQEVKKEEKEKYRELMKWLNDGWEKTKIQLKEERTKWARLSSEATAARKEQKKVKKALEVMQKQLDVFGKKYEALKKLLDSKENVLQEATNDE